MAQATERLPLVRHWLAGAPAEREGRTALVNDPARGVPIREVGLADDAAVDEAVGVAEAAAEAWGEMPAPRRAALLAAWAQLIRANEDRLLAVIGEEHGKVRSDAAGEVQRGLEVLDMAAGAGPLLLKGEFSDQVAGGVDVHSLRRPLGVCVAITPFNFPFMIPMWLTSVALVCGNTIVLKPSEQNPSCAMLLAELAEEAGFPAGVFNVLHGDKVAVDGLLDHDDVAAVSFVGSTPVARSVYERGTAAGKRVQAFGGAKNHMVVLPDADVAFAAQAAASAAFGSTGQRCMAISAVVAVDAAAAPLADELDTHARDVRVGPTTDPEADMGPLVSAAALDRVLGHIDGAERDGARLVRDGRGFQHPEHPTGFFVGPTVLDGVTPEMDVYREEVFGPVLSVLHAEDLDAAIDLVNANPYGNGASIFTSSGAAARHFERRVTAGMVGINVPIPIPVAQYSFGGWKASRFGDVHMSGPEGYRFFTKGKVVTSRWTTPSRRRVDLAFGAAER